MKPKAGFDNMSGNIGWVLEPINPEGLIKVNNEIWKARYIEESLAKSQQVGNEVIVVSRKGLTLFVRGCERLKEDKT